MSIGTIRNYLKSRDICDEVCSLYLRVIDASEYTFRVFKAAKEDYIVNCFLNDSEMPGKGLIITNTILQTENAHLLAIGLVDGDDVICIEPDSGCIKLWLIQNGDGALIPVADTLQEFLCMCIA